MSVLRSSSRRMSAKGLGLAVIVTVLVAGVATFELTKLTTVFGPDETVEAEFPRGYKLEAYQSKVRIAGVTVGKVTGVEQSDDDESVLVTMKIDDEARDKLGATPSASVRPTTLLGGVYYVALAPGGDKGGYDGETIPVERTSVPVELGEVLSAVDSSAQDGVRSSVRQLDKSLRPRGQRSLRNLLRDAPGTLKPAAGVLDSARGNRPATDLTQLVSGLEGAAATMTRKQGQLDLIFTDLGRSTAALASSTQPLDDSLETLPETLRTTRTGMDDLGGTLNELTATAGSLQPTARRLNTLLEDLDPVLVRARPVLRDARALVDDARPVVRRLIPTSSKATDVLTNVEGPVLDRVNGPLKKMVMSPWKGTGPYKKGGNDNLFYEELGFLGVDGAKVWQTHDSNGAHARLMAGVGVQTLGGHGSTMNVEEYLELLGLNQPPGPQEEDHSDRSGTENSP